MIKINNLNKYFFKGRSNEIHVINDVSIELPEKGIVTFFGKSGCGKTTLLNTLGGLDDFKSGSIEIDGHDINKKTDYVRNKYIGYIFQNYNLNLKVNNYENVAEALRLCGMTDENVIKERVEAALTNVGLEKFIYRMPDTLSGGQKQRVAIARAIVKNPKIILADEPTGNLDEANTVMIMDLLKSISEDHLVLLVTHEANLVDYYCDKVIELADGKIQKVYDNENANGYVAKDKNVIYLGEYEKREAFAGGATLICYGEDMPEDIQIQLVNQDGKLCVKINSPKVKVVDENSEIEFREGVFEAEKTENRLSTNLDMSKLPEFEGKNYGRLFNFKTALKEGWNSISANKKKSNKALRNALLFFAILITLMVGIDAVGINKYIEKKQSVNYNTYTAFAVDNEYVKMLYESVEKGEHGIDYVRPVNGDVNVVYENRTDIFESFNYQSKAVFFDFINPIKSQGVLLPERLAINKKVLAGKSSDLGDKELVISRSSADYLLENVKYNFVKNYEDLIGLPLENYRIAGVVDTDENAFYVNEFNLINDVKLDGIYYDKKSDEVIEPGKTVATINKNSSLSVKEGDTVELYGLTLTVSKVKEVKASFTEEDMQWLIDDGMPDSIDSAGGEIMAVYGDEWGSWAMSITDSQYEAYKYVRQYGFEIKDSITYQVCQEDYIKAVDNKNSELSNVYMVVHSSNLEYTEGFLNTKFEKQKLPQGIEKAVISPISRIQADLDEIEMDLFDSCMTLFGFLVVLCFCVYMIMRSSVMSRIKEIGIYRSIGVTKKNLIFCYFVESVLLTTISVLPGFLIVVGITNYMKYVVGVTLAIFLPWWICLGLLALFYFVCVGCGILPAIILMNSTPSQIMAKYDV